jgi:hypothetical protein
MNRSFAAFLVVLIAGIAIPASAADASGSAKRRDIQRLMEVTGSAELAAQFTDVFSEQMFHGFKAVAPDIPVRALEVMKAELTQLFSERMAGPEGLLEQMVPIYDRHFSHRDIQELLAFYRTPIGRKSIAVMPIIVQESMLAGQRWAQALGPEMQRRLMEALQREALLPARK